MCREICQRLQAPVTNVQEDLSEGDARPNDGYGTGLAPQGGLLTWPYAHKNQLYYDSSQRAAVALTDAERSRQVQVCFRLLYAPCFAPDSCSPIHTYCFEC